MKRRFLALVLAGCLAAVLSTAAWASETPTSVSTEMELTTALGDTAVTSIQLKGNIDISNTLVVTKDVTLDLNGFVLKITGSGSVIKIESGTLTLVDSNPSAEHKFTNDGNDKPWRLDETAGAEKVKGGVITGGTGNTYKYNNDIGQIVYNDCGGGVFVAPGASFIMEGGNIVGCSAGKSGGGVKVTNDGDFKMSGGTISGCTAGGGGVNNLGSFTMNGGTIRNCTAAYGYGGGISSLRNITICGDAYVRDCTASQDKSSAMYLNPSNPADRAVIEGGTFRGNIYASPYCTGMVAVTGGTFDPGQPNGITLHTVTFNSNGGSDVPEQIRANAAATKPDSRKAGYTLVGWYTSEACTAAYDFTQPVTDSVTLYAKWEAAPRYYYNSGTTTDTDNADEDKKGSPKTFDPGAGIYAVSVALSLTGTAWIGRKRH